MSSQPNMANQALWPDPPLSESQAARIFCMLVGRRQVESVLEQVQEAAIAGGSCDRTGAKKARHRVV